MEKGDCTTRNSTTVKTSQPTSIKANKALGFFPKVILLIKAGHKIKENHPQSGEGNSKREATLTSLNAHLM